MPKLVICAAMAPGNSARIIAIVIEAFRIAAQRSSARAPGKAMVVADGRMEDGGSPASNRNAYNVVAAAHVEIIESRDG